MVGGGLFSGFASLRISEAWELFGAGNGVDSLAGMRNLVRRLPPQENRARRGPVDQLRVRIRDTAFFHVDDDVGAPPGLKPNVVQGKGFDLADPAVTGYFGELLTRLLGGTGPFDTSETWPGGPTYGDPRLTLQRLGQQAFLAVVLHA